MEEWKGNGVEPMHKCAINWVRLIPLDRTSVRPGVRALIPTGIPGNVEQAHALGVDRI